MANWQDIRALEERIYEQVEEFLNNQEAYAMPVLNVYLDHDDMTYKAAAEDGLRGTILTRLAMSLIVGSF